MLFSRFISAARRFNIILNEESEVGIRNYSKPKNQQTQFKIASYLEGNDRIEKITPLGYVASLTDKTAAKLKKHPKIAIIEEDKIIKIAGLSFGIQKVAPWGLSRLITPITTNLDYFYEYISEGGKGVTVYILDTGIDYKHPEFEGRAILKYNNIEGSPTVDENGHGTHCAGIIGSRTYGVAKGCKLIGVKVLDKEGIGSISKLIDGIDFVIKDILNSRREIGYDENTEKVIVNLSVGGERSEALNYTIKLATKRYGIHFSSAAGNEGNDACKFSPASSSSCLTIGASNEHNQTAEFSNTGDCVDLYAPGTNILSTWIGNRTRIVSGTSMAAPHVAGIMAIYLSLANFEPDEMRTRIVMDSVQIVESIKRRDFSGYRFQNPKIHKLASLSKLYDRIKQFKDGYITQ